MKCKYVPIVLVTLVLLTGCGGQDNTEFSYTDPPEFVDEFVLTLNNDTLTPSYLQLYNDTFFVTYEGLPVVGMYDSMFTMLWTAILTSPEHVLPTSIVISDTTMYVCDLFRNRVILYDRNGLYYQSFDRYEDDTLLEPIAGYHYGGVLYVCDLKRNNVLAVSTVTVENITELGELILTIPKEDTMLSMPLAVYITEDGRAVIADGGRERIRVFTCDGKFMYDFDPLPGGTPAAIAQDNRVDRSLSDKNDKSFDPSGIRYQGRFHIADPKNGSIHAFNPLGRYLFSYPDDNSLGKPRSITIDKKRRHIYVADQIGKRIIKFRY